MSHSTGSIEWNQHLGQVLDHVTDSTLWQYYGLLINKISRFDDIAVILFQRGQAPRLLHYAGNHVGKRLVANVFLEGLYVLDPFYKRAYANQWGFLSLNEIVPDGFYDGDLYNLYYKKSGIIDEVGFVLKLDESSFLYNTMARFNDAPSFTEADKRNFREVEPLIQSIASQFWRFHDHKTADPTQPLHDQITQVLGNFGSSLLTDREMEVVHKILNGYSAQAIATNLKISINTVKLHRKNAYAKLDISSQNELFHLFLDSLSCVTDTKNTDPLIAYMNKPEP